MVKQIVNKCSFVRFNVVFVQILSIIYLSILLEKSPFVIQRRRKNSTLQFCKFCRLNCREQILSFLWIKIFEMSVAERKISKNPSYVV